MGRIITEAPNFDSSIKSGEMAPRIESRAEGLQREVLTKIRRMSRDQRVDIVGNVTESVYKQGLYYGKERIPLIPIPIFIDKETMRIKGEEVHQVHNALIKVESLALSDTILGKRIFDSATKDMSDVERELLLRAKNRLPDTAKNRNTRFDTFFNPESGKMQVIEGNTTNPEGMLYHMILQKAGLRLMTELGYSPDEFDQVKNSAAHQVVRMFQDEYGRREKNKLQSIGMVYEQDHDISIANQSELPILQNFFQTQGIDTVIGGPKDVEIYNGKMYLNGHKIDAMWRNAVDLTQAMKHAPGFIEVMSHPDKYVVKNDDTGRLMGSKQLLGELYDADVQEAAQLTPKEIKAIHEIVPFSFNPAEVERIEGPRKETKTPREYLIDHRDNLVLKRISGTHGLNIHFGVNANGWNEIVDRAITDSDHIAQVFIPYKDFTVPTPTINEQGDLEEKPHVRDINVHVIGGKMLGTSICRAIPERTGEISPLNVSSGGGLQPSLIV